MNHVTLGTLEVGRIGLGAMGMSAAYTGAGTDEAESIRTIHRALDLGVTLIDTAEVYGPHTNEELVGQAIKDRRDDVVLATKFGHVQHRRRNGPDSSPANIRIAVEGSLQAARHRPHRSVLPASGRPGDPDRGHRRCARRAGCRRQGPPHRPVRSRVEHHPPGPRRASRHRAAVGVLTVDSRPGAGGVPGAAELGIGFVPYSPLGHGFLTGEIRSIDDLDDNDWRKTNPDSPARTSSATCASPTRSKRSPPKSAPRPRKLRSGMDSGQGDDIAPIPGTKRMTRSRRTRGRQHRAERRAATASQLPSRPQREITTTSSRCNG